MCRHSNGVVLVSVVFYSVCVVNGVVWCSEVKFRMCCSAVLCVRTSEQYSGGNIRVSACSVVMVLACCGVGDTWLCKCAVTWYGVVIGCQSRGEVW